MQPIELTNPSFHKLVFQRIRLFYFLNEHTHSYTICQCCSSSVSAYYYYDSCLFLLQYIVNLKYQLHLSLPDFFLILYFWVWTGLSLSKWKGHLNDRINRFTSLGQQIPSASDWSEVLLRVMVQAITHIITFQKYFLRIPNISMKLLQKEVELL